MNLPKLPKNDSLISVNVTAQDRKLKRNPRSWKVNLEKLFGMCRRKRRGVAVVEFAIVAPLFFLLILGMVEIGRMVMVQQIITNASREGARIAILDGTTTTEVKNKVKAYLTAANIKGADEPVVSPDPPTGAGYGQPVTVTVSIDANKITLVPLPKFSSGKKLQASTVMRRETVQ
jgi:Flp pilus assembly protein TadG